MIFSTGYKPLIHAVQSHLELLSKVTNSAGLKGASSTSSLPSNVEPKGKILPPEEAKQNGGPVVSSSSMEVSKPKQINLQTLDRNRAFAPPWVEPNNNVRPSAAAQTNNDEHCVVNASSPEQTQCIIM